MTRSEACFPAHPRYSFSRKLGGGGAGSVYLARDVLLDGRRVAFKLCHPSVTPEDLLKEFRVLRELRHPRIARSHDFGRLPGSGLAYLTMDYVSGVDLATAFERMRGRRKSKYLDEVLAVIEQLVDVIEYLHGRDLLHLDLKPSNVILSSDGVTLIDFGLLLRVRDDPTRKPIGTALYTAPEVFRGEPLDCRTDLYSLGATLYRVLTGAHPVPGDSPEAIARSHLRAPPTPSPRLPAEIAPIVMKLLAKSPDHRYQTAREVREALPGGCGAGAGPTRTAASLEPDLVGRKTEIGRFFGWLEELSRDGPSVLTVSGQPGIGKTRFIHTCVTELIGRGIIVVSNADVATGDREAWRLLVKRIVALCKLSPGRRRRYRFLLTSLGLARDTASQREIAELDLEKIRVRAFGEFCQLLDELPQGPVVLIVEDLDRLGPADRFFAKRFLNADSVTRSDRVVGLIVTFREEADPRPVPTQGTHIGITPLSDHEQRQVCRSVAASTGRKSIETLVSSSGGNPGVLMQLIHESDSASGDATSVPPPRNYLDVLRRRLATLDEAERDVVLHLTLLGRRAKETPLRELTLLRPGELRSALRALAATGLVRRSRSGYFVDNDLLTQLTPGNLLFDDETLRAAHRRIGRMLLETPDGRSEAVLHMLRAGDADPGLDLADDAGEELRQSGRIEEAIELYETALLHSEGLPVRATFLERLGDLKSQCGEFDEASRAYERLLGASPGPADRMRILRKRGGIQLRSGLGKEALESFQDAMQLADAAGDVDEEIRLVTELASTYLFQGAFQESSNYANRGLELLSTDRAQELAESTRALHGLNLHSIAGHILLRQFEFDRATERYLQSLDFADRIDSPSSTALILNNLGIAYHQSNRLGKAMTVYGRSMKLSERIGDDTTLFSIRCNLASIRARLGEFPQAETILTSLEKMPHVERSKRGKLFFLYTKALIDRLALRDAANTWEACLALARELPDPLIASYGQVYLLENEIHHGRWASARDVLEAIRGAGGLDVPLERAVNSRAAYLEALCGNETVARRLANEVLESFMSRQDDRRRPSHGELWEWLLAASALLEIGQYDRAESWFEKAFIVFRKSRQSPGALECALLLGDCGLRCRDAKAAERWLGEARAVMSKHELPSTIRNASVRIPFLEVRLGMLTAESSSGASDTERSPPETSDLLADAGGNIPHGSTWEMVWLLELVRSEVDPSAPTAAIETSRRAFVAGLRESDRDIYLARDHGARLGLIDHGEGGERSAASEANWLRRVLGTLATLRTCRNPATALDLIVEVTGARSGAILRPDGGCIVRRDAVEKRDAARPPMRDEDSVRFELKVPGRAPSGVLKLEQPALRGQPDFAEYLELIGQLLAAALEIASKVDGGDTTRALKEETTSTRTAVSLSVVGTDSSRMADVLRIIRQTRDSLLPVLLTGESGVGKDFLARWSHTLGPRREQAFIALDTAAIPANLFEAELFGYEKGAFTGADESKRGALLEAQHGTVYLDNVDSTPLDVQVKLLRVLEESRIRPLGSHDETALDIRVIASSQSDLRRLCDRSQFREDLFFRLSGISIDVPPLRERVEDIQRLVAHFQRQLPTEAPEFRESAWEAMKSYSWPGNIRELESLVRRLALTCEGPIGPDDVLDALGQDRSQSRFPRWVFKDRSHSELLEVVNREYLLYVFDRFAGDIDRIAEDLGLSKRGVYKRFAQAGLRLAELRGRTDRP